MSYTLLFLSKAVIGGLLTDAGLLITSTNGSMDFSYKNDIKNAAIPYYW